MDLPIRDRLLPVFRDDADRVRGRLAEALGPGRTDAVDVDDARREVHALKGAAAVLGLADAVSLCRGVERVLEVLGSRKETVRENAREAVDHALRTIVAVATSPDSPPVAQVGRDLADLERLLPGPGH